MKHNSIKNLFIAGLTLLSFGFLSAQFVIPSGINNALQVIQRVLVTTTGTFTGAVVMDTNTGASNIYINPSFLPISQVYSGQYVLTVNASGYLSLTTGATNISGATISGGNLLLSLSNGTVINAGNVTGPQGTPGTNGTNGTNGIQGVTGAMGNTGVGISNIVSNTTGTITIQLTNGSGYTFNLPAGGGTGSQTLGLLGNTLSISNGNSVDLGSLGFWSLLGNAGTNPTINFMGTTDNQDLVFKTNNQERMRILGSSGYIGIGTDTPLTTLNVSGSTFLQDGDLSFVTMQNLGANIGAIGMQLNDPLGEIGARILIYDNRPGGDTEGGISIATQSNINIPGLDQEANINSKNGESININVMSGVDTTNLNLQNTNSSGSIAYGARIDMDANFIKIASESSITVIPDGLGSANTYGQTGTNMDITPEYMYLYGSGGSGNLFFDSQLGRFGFSTWNPGNIVHIANSVNNTLGLRLSAMGGGYTNRVLGLDANQDVVPLAHISTLQGGGGGPTSQYLKLGELDYNQLNGWNPLSPGLDTIALTNGQPLPANVIVKNIFVKVNTGFARAGFSTISGAIFCSLMNPCDIIDFSLIGDSNLLPGGLTNGSIFSAADSFGWGILNQQGTFHTPVSFFQPTTLASTPYYIYPRYQSPGTYNDRVQGHASFVVEYETMPAISF